MLDQEVGREGRSPDRTVASRQPNRTSGKGVESRLGTQKGTGSRDHRLIRQWSSPGSRLDWATHLDSGKTQGAGCSVWSVVGVNSGFFSVSQMVIVNRCAATPTSGTPPKSFAYGRGEAVLVSPFY